MFLDIDHLVELFVSEGCALCLKHKPPTVQEAAVCGHCGGGVVLHDGDCVCMTCGGISCRFIDIHAEWRSGPDSNRTGADMNRCGMPVNELLPESSLGSTIGYSKSRSDTKDAKLVRRYHLWNSMSYKERTLLGIFDMLTVNATNHGITRSILEEAKALYKQISEVKITRGNNRSGLIAAAVYIACKNAGVPRSIKEIAGIFGLETTTMTRCCKRFQEQLRTNPRTSMPSDFVARFCSRLRLHKEQKEVCIKLLEATEHDDAMSESTPPTIAAATIYMCGMLFKWDINKKDLADVCGISQVTVTKCVKKLEPYFVDALSSKT